MTTKLSKNSQSDEWYDGVLSQIIDRYKRILKPPLNNGISYNFPENIGRDPRTVKFTLQIIDQLGMTFPDTKGVEIFKKQIAEDFIGWMMIERPDVLNGIIELLS